MSDYQIDIPLMLFAKAPIAGLVKTRLQPECSAQQAADIAKILLEQSIKRATQHWPGSVVLSVWLDHEHEFIQRMLREYPVRLALQGEGDLGEKMRLALEEFGYPAAVMGSDAPHISQQSLTQAHRGLAEGRSVIGPSTDGGYYFLGLQSTQTAIFTDIKWGASEVLQTTMNRAAESGLILEKLTPLNDVDEWGDVVAVAADIAELRHYLQAHFPAAKSARD